IRLIKTPKVIKMIKEIAPDIFLVGFKLEFNKTKEELILIDKRVWLRRLL
ncbi:unnamed protein product, partial [marine sediment metagenome]